MGLLIGASVDDGTEGLLTVASAVVVEGYTG
jgi:hypothetical protein